MTTPLAPGLCSITLRQLDADEVLATAVRAGVEGIEWGGDVHVPAGDHGAAERVGQQCHDAGVEVVSYGTYLGMSADADADLDAAAGETLDTARSLGAPMVRVWTELGITPDAPVAPRAQVVERTARIVAGAAERDLTVALEFHPGTLTHTAAGARALMDEIGSAALRTHWQPDPTLDDVEALAQLDAVSDRLAHLHVFRWGAEGIADRRALAEGEALWPAALQRASQVPPPPGARRRFALCEYVRGDDPDQLTVDVATLSRWIADLGEQT